MCIMFSKFGQVTTVFQLKMQNRNPKNIKLRNRTKFKGPRGSVSDRDDFVLTEISHFGKTTGSGGSGEERIAYSGRTLGGLLRDWWG